MPTTSAVPTFRAAFVAAMAAAATDLQVTHGWAGEESEAEGVFLKGSVAEPASEVESGTRSIKTGRQHRNETSRTVVVFQTYAAADLLDEAANAEARAYELFGLAEDVVATTPALGGTGQVCQFDGHTLTLRQFGRGWAARIEAVLSNTARLT